MVQGSWGCAFPANGGFPATIRARDRPRSDPEESFTTGSRRTHLDAGAPACHEADFSAGWPTARNEAAGTAAVEKSHPGLTHRAVPLGQKRRTRVETKDPSLTYGSSTYTRSTYHRSLKLIFRMRPPVPTSQPSSGLAKATAQ